MEDSEVHARSGVKDRTGLPSSGALRHNHSLSDSPYPPVFFPKPQYLNYAIVDEANGEGESQGRGGLRDNRRQWLQTALIRNEGHVLQHGWEQLARQTEVSDQIDRFA